MICSRILPSLAIGLLITLSAPAVTIENATFAPTVKTGETTLALRGAGLLKWKLFFKVYVGALYLPADLPSDELFGDEPKQLVFHYLMDFDKEDFGKGAAPYLEKNLTEAEQRAIAARVARINALYEDIKAGDRYTLTYLPDKGTELAKNGRVLGTIPGADFAACYFRIWLGEKPISEELRDKLLHR